MLSILRDRPVLEERDITRLEKESKRVTDDLVKFQQEQKQGTNNDDDDQAALVPGDTVSEEAFLQYVAVAVQSEP